MDQGMSDLAAPDLLAPYLSVVALPTRQKSSLLSSTLLDPSNGGLFHMNSIKTISVCGLGKLGACIAATLAARGFEVVGVDIDKEKVKKINAGLAPLDEPLLAETIAAGHSRLRATLDPRETVATDATFFIPPSPVYQTEAFPANFC